ncbi:outer membrane beta-barrel protein [Bacteroidota bacterium]
MKRNQIISVLFFLTIFNFSFAQPKENLGLIFGYNMSNQYWKYDNFPDGSIGYHSKSFLPRFNLGVIYNLSISNSLYISPSILCNQKGFKENQTFYYVYNGDLIKAGSKLRLNYITVELPIKYKTDILNANPYIKIGPIFDYLLSYSKKSKDDLKLKLYDDIYKDNQQIVIGYIISVGGQVMEKDKFRIDMEIVFNYNITNPFDKEIIGLQEIEVKNYIFGLNIITKLNK